MAVRSGKGRHRNPVLPSGRAKQRLASCNAMHDGRMMRTMPRVKQPPLLLAARLRVERDGVELVGPERYELLRQIDACGSLTAAARAAGVSYRTAWSAVESLNHLAGQPLVERSQGGAGGGGARLTPAGQRLMRAYATLLARQQEFLDWLGAGGSELDEFVGLLGRLDLRTSARNQLAGTVERWHAQGPQVRLVLRLSNGQDVSVLLSERSRARLGLEPGVEAIALFKATAVSVVDERAMVPARSNRLAGNVAALAQRDGHAEIDVALPGGLTVHSLQAMEGDGDRWTAGRAAVAVFDPAAVLVAAAD
jgi:molybdate transport system regulatory protein